LDFFGCIKNTCAFIALLSALLAISIEPSSEAPSPTKIVVQASAFAQNIALITAAEARNFIFIVTP